MIQEEAFRCKSITEKLLDFSRCNDIKRERTDLAGLIQGVVDMIRHIGKYRGKTIVFQPTRSGHGPRGQPGDQAGGPQSGRQRARVDGCRTERCGSRRGTARAWPRWSSADNGCGMSPDVLENIFEPFFTRRRDGKGTGLGLSITHRIVSQHHGEIMADEPGRGPGLDVHRPAADPSRPRSPRARRPTIDRARPPAAEPARRRPSPAAVHAVS